MKSSVKYKEIKTKNGEHIAIACKRADGKEDFLTIQIRDDVIYLNNRFMGACLKKIEGDMEKFQIV